MPVGHLNLRPNQVHTCMCLSTTDTPLHASCQSVFKISRKSPSAPGSAVPELLPCIEGSLIENNRHHLHCLWCMSCNEHCIRTQACAENSHYHSLQNGPPRSVQQETPAEQVGLHSSPQSPTTAYSYLCLPFQCLCSFSCFRS